MLPPRRAPATTVLLRPMKTSVTRDLRHIRGGPRFSFLPTPDTVTTVADSLDVNAMLARFQQRAGAVRSRPLPPVEGPERKRIADQRQLDFMDFAMIGDADWTFEDGVLTLRIDLRPPSV
jgi:hypothetical protein